MNESPLILPAHVREALSAPAARESSPFDVPKIAPRDMPDPEAPAEEKARSIPDPVGYKLLCLVPEIDERFHGSEVGLVKADAIRKADEHSTVVLFVLKAGPQAYSDKERFPDGPWCKEGDFVLVRAYSGTRFMVAGKEMRLLNDDQIEAVVQDPRLVTRVM